MRFKLVLGTLLMAVCTLSPLCSRADLETAPILNSPEDRWTAPTLTDQWSTAAFLLSATFLEYSNFPPYGNWANGILFDDAVRNSLRAPTQDGRILADRWSAISLAASVSAPLLLDSLGLSLLRDHDGDKAWRVALVDLQSIAVSAFASEVVKNFIYRRRPYEKSCEEGDPNYSPDCFVSDSDRSFYSGHAALAFTGASLVCLNHLKFAAFRDSTADTAVCVSAMTVATGTGILRIVADKHYASDVIFGAMTGIFSGYFLPQLLHSRESLPRKVSLDWSILPKGGDAVMAMGVLRF